MPRESPSTRSRAGPPTPAAQPSTILDTRVIYRGDNLDQSKKPPDACVDPIYIDPPAWPKPLHRGEGPPFNSNRNYGVFWRETKEQRAIDDRPGSTQTYVEYTRPCCVELAQLSRGGFPRGWDPANMNGDPLGRRLREASQ